MTELWLTDAQVLGAVLTGLAAFLSGFVAAITGVINVRRAITRSRVASYNARVIHDCIHEGQRMQTADAARITNDLAEVRSMLATLLDAHKPEV